jgi:aminobenzoyl-glutamate transport protein
VTNAGIGTLVAMMLPYSVVFLVAWSGFLLLYWAFGIPLGIQASYVYPP